MGAIRPLRTTQYLDNEVSDRASGPIEERNKVKTQTHKRLRHAVIAAASVATLGVGALVASPASASNPTVAVDLSYSLGSVVHGAAGALYGLSENGTPPASDLSGLNFQTIAQMAPGGTQHPDGDALKVGPEFYGAGGKNVLIYLQDYYPSWPYAKVSMSDYSALVKSEVAKVQAAPNASKYIYVPFNEPDWIWYGNSGSKLTDFENDWKTIFLAIRSADSSAQIAGPNFENYNDAAYKSFLTFAKANNVLPNLITWHELTLSTLESSWYTHINDFIADEKSVGVSQIPVDIDEYGQQSDMGVPGRMLEYVARFDADRVEGDMSSWYAGEYLGRTLNTSGQKTSGWYFYYWYGQQNGNSARVTPPDGNGTLQAVASISSDKKSARAIIGGSTGSNNITFSGLSSTSLGTSPKVTIYTLSNSGDSESNGPTTTSTYTGSVSNGSITVTVSNMAADNVYLVTLG
jgi:hypothetical protein